jgi:hypothetical protein
VQREEMDVNGPMYESRITVPAPTMSGPRSSEFSTMAPSPTLTSPRMRERASTEPRMSRSIDVSATRFASSRSSTLPVSFHHPLMTWLRTSRPFSIRYWIASVISSSPRGDGRIASTASKIVASNMYTPTSA